MDKRYIEQMIDIETGHTVALTDEQVRCFHTLYDNQSVAQLFDADEFHEFVMDFYTEHFT